MITRDAVSDRAEAVAWWGVKCPVSRGRCFLCRLPGRPGVGHGLPATVMMAWQRLAMACAGGPHPPGTCAGSLAAWHVANMEQRIPRGRSRACSAMVEHDVQLRRLDMVCDRLSGPVASHHLHAARCPCQRSHCRRLNFQRTSPPKSAVARCDQTLGTLPLGFSPFGVSRLFRGISLRPFR